MHFQAPEPPCCHGVFEKSRGSALVQWVGYVGKSDKAIRVLSNYLAQLLIRDPSLNRHHHGLVHRVLIHMSQQRFRRASVQGLLMKRGVLRVTRSTVSDDHLGVGSPGPPFGSAEVFVKPDFRERFV